MIAVSVESGAPMFYWSVTVEDGRTVVVEAWSSFAAEHEVCKVLRVFSWDVVRLERGAHVLVCEVAGCGSRLTPGDSWSAGRCDGHAHWSDEESAVVADAEYEVRS